jgi:hypothetical protein
MTMGARASDHGLPGRVAPLRLARPKRTDGYEPMTTLEDPSNEHLVVKPPKHWATAVPAVTHAIQYSLEQTSVRRTAFT